MRGHVREVDVALANDLRYLGVAGFGFDSEVARYANEKVRFLKGSLVYLYSIFRVLPQFKPHRVRIFANERTRDEEIMKPRLSAVSSRYIHPPGRGGN